MPHTSSLTHRCSCTRVRARARRGTVHADRRPGGVLDVYTSSDARTGYQNAPIHSQYQHAGVLLVKALVSDLVGQCSNTASVQQQRTENVLRPGRVPDVVRATIECTGTPCQKFTSCSKTFL
jgi:hypothetical protein